jgi:hypothetical protein
MRAFFTILVGLVNFFAAAVGLPLDDEGYPVSPNEESNRLLLELYPDRAVDPIKDVDRNGPTVRTAGGAPGGLWACNQLFWGGTCQWFPPGYSSRFGCRKAVFDNGMCFFN